MAVRRRAKAKAKPRKKAKAKTKTRRTKAAVGKAWSADEIKILRAGYKAKPASKIAKELRRSLASVRGKISALGLTKGPARRKTKAKTKTKAKARARKARPKARTKRAKAKRTTRRRR